MKGQKQNIKKKNKNRNEKTEPTHQTKCFCLHCLTLCAFPNVWHRLDGEVHCGKQRLMERYPIKPTSCSCCKHPHTICTSILPVIHLLSSLFFPSCISTIILSIISNLSILNVIFSCLSPWMHLPHPRPRGPAASAGQCHAGCDWHVPADGGDREAGSAQGPRGREGPLLHFHQLPSARCGEEIGVEGWWKGFKGNTGCLTVSLHLISPGSKADYP